MWKIELERICSSISDLAEFLMAYIKNDMNLSLYDDSNLTLLKKKPYVSIYLEGIIHFIMYIFIFSKINETSLLICLWH